VFRYPVYSTNEIEDILVDLKRTHINVKLVNVDLMLLNLSAYGWKIKALHIVNCFFEDEHMLKNLLAFTPNMTHFTLRNFDEKKALGSTKNIPETFIRRLIKMQGDVSIQQVIENLIILLQKEEFQHTNVRKLEYSLAEVASNIPKLCAIFPHIETIRLKYHGTPIPDDSIRCIERTNIKEVLNNLVLDFSFYSPTETLESLPKFVSSS